MAEAFAAAAGVAGVAEPEGESARAGTVPFPAPRVEASGSGLGRLVGREHESAALHALLSRHRLVTVTGPVGVGKSALASAALAARARATGTAVVHVRVPDPSARPGAGGAARSARSEGLLLGGGPAARAATGCGVGSVGLGEVSPFAGSSVAEEAAHAEGRAARALAEAVLGALLGAGAGAGAGAGDGDDDADCGVAPAAAFDAFVAHRRGGEVLLLLDDVDPVHLPALRLVARLLRERPAARVVVTSRRPLGLGEERVVRLAPLAVRGAEGGRPAPAVRLFLERARAVRPGFVADEATSRAVAEICTLLDGLPLAVELAACGLDRLDPAALAAQLHERGQCWLGAPAADPAGAAAAGALPRHRTLRQALRAVDALCDPRDRAVWSRAGAFAGGFTEAAAVAVCSGGEVAAEDVPACLARLTAVGVLVPMGDPGGVRTPRLRMSRAAQDFARERLSANGEAAIAQDRLERHARRTSASAANLWDSGAQAQAVELVQDELPNLLVALSRAPADGDHAEELLQAALDLWFWWVLHEPTRGRWILAALLPACPPDGVAARRSQWLAAWLGAGSAADAGDPLGAAWAAALLADDRAGTGRIAFVQALARWRRGDVDAAAELLREASEQIPAYALGGPSAATALAALALVEAARAPAAARRAARHAITWSGEHGDAWACFLARYALTLVDAHTGRAGLAARRARRVLAAQRQDLPAHAGAAALARLAGAAAEAARGAGRVPDGTAAQVPGGGHGPAEGGPARTDGLREAGAAATVTSSVAVPPTRPAVTVARPLTDARHALPLPPAASACAPHNGAPAAAPGEQPGCVGGPLRTYRRK